MRHIRRPFSALVVEAALVLSASAAANQDFSSGVRQGDVNSPEITEASGIVGSRTNPRVLWTHNDSGDQPRIFAINDQARLLGDYAIPGINKVDFEDIAIGPGPVAGITYLYVGDIGDNTSIRSNIIVHRIPEPAVYLRQDNAPVARVLKGTDTLILTYPDGPHDAEAMMIDPVSGDLFIATKQFNTTRIYRADAADLVAGGNVALSFVRTIAIGTRQLATAADISRRGNEIIIKGYGFARLWPRADGETIGAALAGSPINIPFVPFPTSPQGEAMGFDQFGQDYVSLSEGSNQPLYRYARISHDGPDLPITLIDAGTLWKYLDDGSDQGTAWRTPQFDDSAWPVGDAQLGYGDGDKETVIDFGGDPANRHITTWFRKSFQVESAARIKSLRALLVFDDGAAVYINGIEVARVNLAPNAGFDDPATTPQDDLEDAWLEIDIDPAFLVVGDNVIAVEVHQHAPDSDDLSFDCQILGFPAAIAEIQSVSVITGTQLGGGLVDLGSSDDSYVHARSGFGLTLIDLHHMEMRIGATTTVQSPTMLDLTIESRISEPAGIAQIGLLNHNTAEIDPAGRYALGNTDAINTIVGIDATNFVNAQGDIELSIKHIVFVPFLAFTFESFIDLVELVVR